MKIMNVWCLFVLCIVGGATFGLYSFSCTTAAEQSEAWRMVARLEQERQRLLDALNGPLLWHVRPALQLELLGVDVELVAYAKQCGRRLVDPRLVQEIVVADYPALSRINKAEGFLSSEFKARLKRQRDELVAQGDDTSAIERRLLGVDSLAARLADIRHRWPQPITYYWEAE